VHHTFSDSGLPIQAKDGEEKEVAGLAGDLKGTVTVAAVDGVLGRLAKGSVVVADAGTVASLARAAAMVEVRAVAERWAAEWVEAVAVTDRRESSISSTADVLGVSHVYPQRRSHWVALVTSFS
jgi:hypothetical protein